MKRQCKLRPWLMLVLTSVLLAGCAGTKKPNVLPDTGPSMQQIYEQQMSKNAGNKLAKMREQVQISSADANPSSAYTRLASNEIRNLFPRLKNPMVVLYVYPHLAGQEQIPVPGYSTVLPLYVHEHVKLPTSGVWQ